MLIILQSEYKTGYTQSDTELNGIKEKAASAALTVIFDK
jgi:hypothetical protein